MPDDERKGRRLGDETKGRIADLASGWTVDSDAPPVPEPPIKREASSPARVPPDAPRRKHKTQPPPPPGSPARKALEDKILELREAYDDEPDEPPRPPAAPPADRPPPAPPRPPRVATGASPVAAPAGKSRAPRAGDAPDMSSLPEADRTKENRGAVGIKHDRNASLTANAASGTIGETPAPLFDRAAIAAGQRGAVASERVTDRPRQSPGDARNDAREPTPNGRLGSPPGDAVPARPQDRSPSGKAAHAGTGPTAARGSGAIADRPARAASPRPGPPARPAPPGGDRDDDDRDDDAAPGSPSPSPSSGPSSTGDPARRTVPVGEFDHGETVLEQDKLRVAHAQATIKRDAASALLGIAAPAPARMPAAEVLFDEPTRKRGETGFDEPTRKRGDPGFDEPTRRTGDQGSDEGSNETSTPGSRAALAAFNDASGSSTGRFDRGDPTFGDARGDATAISAPATGAAAPTGTLRSSAALPRRRGVAGDLRYVATVVVGLRRARREVAELTGRQATRQQSRRHHLVTLGRAAVTADGLEHPALDAARDQLATIEDERSQHAGHVVAADAELIRVRRDRDAKAKKYGDEIAALDVELAGLARKLEPMDKEVAGVKKRGVDLHEALRRIDAKIAATEASLTSAKGGKLDRAEIQAEIATLRADRKAIQSDEPAIAGQLDALSPRIAALEAARGEAQRRRVELDAGEHDDQRRVEELLAAIGAKRKVVDRAAADAEALRDKILFKLGERLYVDRPDDLSAELAPIDEIDLELGSADRRMMELREIIASVDRWKLARGIALLVVVLAALGALATLATWLVYLRR